MMDFILNAEIFRLAQIVIKMSDGEQSLTTSFINRVMYLKKTIAILKIFPNKEPEKRSCP